MKAAEKKRQTVKKRAIVLAITTMALLTISGCSGGAATEEISTSSKSEEETISESSTSESNVSESKEEATFPEETQVNIEDVDWAVEEKIIDEERQTVFGYTNNSPYPIVEVSVVFAEKEGLATEERYAVYEEISDALDLSDEELEELKDRPISVTATAEVLAQPGETKGNAYLYYFDGLFSLLNKEHYQVLDPDMATIRFLHENEIHTEYYDFRSGSYSTEAETEPATYWSESPLAEQVPVPESIVIQESGRDDEECFMFRAWGFSLEKFNEYIEQCKEKGFSQEPAEYEGFYSADNAEGVNIYANYEKENERISVIVSAPEEEADAEAAQDAADESEIREDLKAFVDEYEQFMTEYTEFLQRYSESEDTSGMLEEYMALLEEQAEYAAAAASYQSEDLTAAEAQYLLDAQNRINEMLLEAST